MTSGIRSHGTILGIGDGGSPENFDTITERFAIPAVGSRGDLIDMSNHDSVAIMEYLPKSLEDGNEMTVEANYVSSALATTAQNKVRAARVAKSTDNWKVQFVNGSYRIFPAIVIGLDDDASELDGRVVFRFVLKIVGNITRVDV